MPTDDELTETIAGNVRFYMARYRISTEQAAIAVGLSTATFRHRKAGRAGLTAIELVKFASLVGVSVDAMVTDPYQVRDGDGAQAPDLDEHLEKERQIDAKAADLDHLARRLRTTLSEATVAVELVRREIGDLQGAHAGT